MKQLLLLFALSLFVLKGTAQTKTITGLVKDDKGTPIQSASVFVKGTSVGTVTNADGLFSFPVSTNARTLVISSVGFSQTEVSIGKNLRFDVSLTASKETELQGVVVTALGITKNRRTLGYSTQTVKSEEIIDKGDGSLLNALQGKLAGAEITGASGSAGASTNIILRGMTSFSFNNQPLFVIDGVPISNDLDQGTIPLYSDQSANRSMDLNINNIESVNVLQGPAAAALYGSRASRGAIIITTKKGSGKRGTVNVTYNTSYTIQKVYGFPELQNEYGQGTNGIFSSIANFSYGPRFGGTPTLSNGLIVAPGQNPVINGVRYNPGDVMAYQAFPSNLEDFFATGTVLENNLTINSGDAKNNYGLSVGSSKQDGILPNSSFKKNNVQFSASSYLTDRLSIKGTATYFNTVQNGITQGGNGAYSSIARLFSAPRSLDMLYYKDHYATPGGYNNWYLPNVYNTVIKDSASAGDNPFYAAYRNPITSNLSRIIGSLTVSFDVNNWLNVSYRAGVDVYTDRRKRITAIGSTQVVRSTYTGSSGTTTGGIMEDMYFRSELNGDLLVTAKKNDIFIKGLNASLLLGQGVNQRTFQNISEVGYGLTVPGYYNITNSTNLSLSNESNSQRRLYGYYGQLSLGYNNYLFLEVTARNDHSSTLPQNNNSFFYPSVSGSFVFTDALKIKSDILSFGKLRLSYSKVGNDADPYLLSNTYTSASFGNNVASYSFPYGSVSGFTANSTIANPDLRPEFTIAKEGGISLGLFKNRLNIDATYYSQLSKDQIISVAVPGSTGYSTKIANLGKMTNKGVELTVSATPLKTKDFSWTVSGNFSQNRNKVIEIAPGVTSFGLTGTVSYSGNIPSIVVGKPYGVITGGKFLTSPNGDRLVDSTTGVYAGFVADQIIADPNKDWIAGLTNTFTYKHFTLSVLVDYKKGGDIESFTVATLRQNGSLKETGVDRDKPKILPGVIDMGGGKYRPNNIQIPAQTYWNQGFGSSTGSANSNELVVFDATCFRVRELSMSYEILGDRMNSKFVKSVRLTVYGRNLFFYAPHCPVDPELSTQGAGNVRGMELLSAPNTRNMGASLRINF